jgi:spectinomycin phosphotransferase
VRALPEELHESALIGALADGWNFDVEAAEYAAVGGGSYHWVVDDREGRRGFVTVDDLDRKPWLGDTRAVVLEGLEGAFDTAVALRDDGLDFVVAPIPARSGDAVLRAGPRYAVALFPFLDGRAGQFGTYDPPEHAAIVAMLAALHEATPTVASIARRIDLALPGRAHLEEALAALRETWAGGPFSERARATLARHASDVVEVLALFDRLAAEVEQRSTEWVVTHGEPHAANVIRTEAGHVLVDWDTVALAPPERDLWMLVRDNADDIAGYSDATGRRPDEVALDFFRLTWDLADLAAFTHVLRSPHEHSADTVKAYDGVRICAATCSRVARSPGGST